MVRMKHIPEWNMFVLEQCVVNATPHLLIVKTHNVLLRSGAMFPTIEYTFHLISVPIFAMLFKTLEEPLFR
jgi:hypothetical protein